MPDLGRRQSRLDFLAAIVSLRRAGLQGRVAGTGAALGPGSTTRTRDPPAWFSCDSGRAFLDLDGVADVATPPFASSSHVANRSAAGCTCRSGRVLDQAGDSRRAPRVLVHFFVAGDDADFHGDGVCRESQLEPGLPRRPRSPHCLPCRLLLAFAARLPARE